MYACDMPQAPKKNSSAFSRPCTGFLVSLLRSASQLLESFLRRHLLLLLCLQLHNLGEDKAARQVAVMKELVEEWRLQEGAALDSCAVF
jgi:hypothetical protein